jgi:tetratricopeptide (TPR) repeat protein
MENLRREQERREKEARKAALWAPVQRLQEAQKLNEKGNQYYRNKQWQQAADAFKAALAKSPNDDVIRANYELASERLAAEQRKEQKRQPQKGKTSPTSPAVSGPSPQRLQEAQNLKEQGNQYSQNKQWQQAADAYRAALKKNPENAEIRRKYARALATLAAEQRKAAKAASETASPKFPPLPRLKEAHNLCQQGNKYYENQQWQQAADAYRAALEKFPGNEEIRNNYALALTHLASEQRKGTKESPRKGPGSTSSGKQLESAKLHSTKAANAAKKIQERDVSTKDLETSMERAKGQAMKGFDTAGDNVGSTLKPLAVDGRNPGREPVILKEKRTEAITKLETQRNEAKNKRIELEQKVAEIEKKPQKTKEETLNLVNLKQNLSNTRNKEIYFNFQINEELRKPSKPNTNQQEK